MWYFILVWCWGGLYFTRGVVIGADGFGYTDNNTGGINKVRQLGSVRIGNYVEIGANSTIDCGRLDNMIVGAMLR